MIMEAGDAGAGGRRKEDLADQIQIAEFLITKVKSGYVVSNSMSGEAMHTDEVALSHAIRAFWIREF